MKLKLDNAEKFFLFLKCTIVISDLQLHQYCEFQSYRIKIITLNNNFNDKASKIIDTNMLFDKIK